jgi:hypothetical protein
VLLHRMVIKWNIPNNFHVEKKEYANSGVSIRIKFAFVSRLYHISYCFASHCVYLYDDVG